MREISLLDTRGILIKTKDGKGLAETARKWGLNRHKIVLNWITVLEKSLSQLHSGIVQLQQTKQSELNPSTLKEVLKTERTLKRKTAIMLLANEIQDSESEPSSQESTPREVQNEEKQRQQVIAKHREKQDHHFVTPIQRQLGPIDRSKVLGVLEQLKFDDDSENEDDNTA